MRLESLRTAFNTRSVKPDRNDREISDLPNGCINTCIYLIIMLILGFNKSEKHSREIVPADKVIILKLEMETNYAYFR